MALVVAFSIESYVQGTYEFWMRLREDQVWARLDVNTVPATELAHFDSMALIDPIAGLSTDAQLIAYEGLLDDEGEQLLGTYAMLTTEVLSGHLQYWTEGEDEVTWVWEALGDEDPVAVALLFGNLTVADGTWRKVPEPSSHLIFPAMLGGVWERWRRRKRN